MQPLITPLHYWPTRAVSVYLLLQGSKRKEVSRMKISRKMQRQVEIKIRHGLATGSLPVIERSHAGGQHTRPDAGKGGGNDLDQGK